MNALLGPVTKGVRRVATKWLAPILPVLLSAVLLGLIAVVLVEPTGLVERVPSTTVPVVGWSVAPKALVFVGVTATGLVVGGICLLGYRYHDELTTYWNTYSAWAQAVLVGFLAATLVAIGCYGAALFDRVPTYATLLGFLVTWPVAAGVVLLFDRRSDGDGSSAFSSVKTGYVHTRGLESRTLSLIVGFLGAMAGGLSLWYAWRWYTGDPSFPAIVAVTVSLWIVITLVVYNRYEASSIERTDISIVTVRTPESRPTRELTIKNGASTSVDLAESRIRDTSFELYRLGVAITLRPGATCTFEIPETFTLEPNDESIDLPLGYSLKRGGETPTLFTRSGDIYALDLADGAMGDPESDATMESEPDADLVAQE
ncbi:hypothetical protein [Halovivax cerinus]|uniref:Uncharacterized protein n=1 Tax=Halovivax cerinus TaxID=1487865 RepID=A0ABD5NQV4_9EURY|nr:hypothetical protein [Halovivax cerinus]